jgi:hypothetical protein
VVTQILSFEFFCREFEAHKFPSNADLWKSRKTPKFGWIWGLVCESFVYFRFCSIIFGRKWVTVSAQFLLGYGLFRKSENVKRHKFGRKEGVDLKAEPSNKYEYVIKIWLFMVFFIIEDLLAEKFLSTKLICDFRFVRGQEIIYFNAVN